jgi:IS30 family transposase
MASGSPLREIARRLDRAASTVSREISRHGGRPTYRAHAADDHAWDSALRPKKCPLAVSPKLRNIVASKLILDWSPEQISGWLKIQFPDGASMRVSHETIYRSLFIQARGVMCRSTSASRKALGNVAQTKTPICCYGNTSREAPICPATLNDRERL